ncbi:MAG: sirohydrochlorin cobaltochelatase [Actinomycetota bacterium]|nr:sirohydrochlorin cobaltochelatase [Actinomycetota bacterium]
MPEAVLLVAHGSRSAAGCGELLALADAVAEARAGTQVRVGFLEMSDPPASTVLDDLLRDGARDVTVVPLMLFAAGHAKSDVPALVLDARAHRRGARIVYGRPLGVDHALLALARRRLRAAGALGLPLAVLARGTSDPDANAEAWRASRLLADMCETQLVVTGFSGLTWPTVTGALEQLRRLGAARVAVFSWFLATGVLLDRMRADWQAFESATGVGVVDAGYFGVEPELIALVWARADEARAGAAAANCDVCAYRRPFPGLADRVGMPIGVGHSHLAAEHRHHAGRGTGHALPGPDEGCAEA